MDSMAGCVAANVVALPEEVTCPVRLALSTAFTILLFESKPKLAPLAL